MPAHNLRPEQIQEAHNALRKHGSQTKAAQALGIPRPTLQARLRYPEPHIAVSKVKSPSQTNNDLLRANSDLQTRVRDLEGQLERARAAKTVKPTVKKISRSEDFLRIAIPDSHGAHADPAAVGAFLQDLKALSPHEIVLLGDHVDCGGFLAQHHDLSYIPETTYTYEDDIKSTSDFLDQIQAAAPGARIHYLEGNHEQRVEKWCVKQCLRNGKDADFLRRQFAPEFLLRLKDRGISYYRRSVQYDGLPVPGVIRLGPTFFTHEPGRGGRPEQYALRFGGCMVHGHEHRARSAVVRTVANGETGVWCPGTLAKQQPFYFHTNLTDHSHGYLVQIVSRSGGFLAINVPIIDGISHLRPLIDRR